MITLWWPIAIVIGLAIFMAGQLIGGALVAILAVSARAEEEPFR